MSIDYSMRLAVGWKVSYDRLRKQFCQETKAKTKTERRFDPKTGKEVDPVEVVVEEGGEVWMFDGEEVAGDAELAELIATYIDGWSWDVGCQMTDETGYIFGPDIRKIKVDGSSYEDGRVDCDGSSLPLKALAILNQNKVVGIGLKLFQLGLIDDGDPCAVHLAWYVS